MEKIRFITSFRQPKADEMIITRSRYLYGDRIALSAWDLEGPYADITQNIPGIPLGENEVIINHDVISANGFDGKDFLRDFLEYLTESSRECVFGPYNTRTLIVTLKDDWESRTVAMEEE